MLGTFLKILLIFTRIFQVITDNSIENIVYCVSNYNLHKREVNYKEQKYNISYPKCYKLFSFNTLSK